MSRLIIDIPWQIKECLNNENEWSALLLAELKEIVNNGTPLPKGHGRLGDLDRLYEVFEKNVVSADAYKELFNIAPTIIEADRSVDKA